LTYRIERTIAVLKYFVCSLILGLVSNNLLVAAETLTTVKPVEPTPRLAFQEDRDFQAWQAELRGELRKLLAVSEQPLKQPAKELKWMARRVFENNDYTMDRVEYVSEPGHIVPAYLLRPKSVKPPYRVMICLQGHSPGMHVSIGRKDPKNLKKVSPMKRDRDFAIQAIKNGWAALVIEQRGFGECAVKGARCNDLGLRSFLKGKPLVGRRVVDVMRGIDFLATQSDMNINQIGCMGNSGGGTVSFFAGCIDDRIGLVVDSCSFCTYADSWLAFKHCSCGFIPNLLTVADMPDLTGLIAPRDLIIVAGRDDPLARLSGVKEGFATAQKIYRKAGVPTRVRLVVGPEGHRFYAKETWPVIEALSKKK
jgi:hypothetical protein